MTEIEKLKENLEIYWQTLYAIRVVTEHVGKRSTARHMRTVVEECRKMADGAIKEVKGDDR